MKSIETRKCDKKDCDYEDRIRKLKKVNGNYFCKKHYKENLKNKREKIKREILGITKEQEIEENKIIEQEKKQKYEKSRKSYAEKNREELNKKARERYKKKRLEKKKESPIIKVRNQKFKPPKIKGAKIKKVSKQLHNYLTREEKQLLFKKYLKKGFSSEEADLKVKRDVSHLQELRDKLREKKQSEEQLNMTFKEEFAKLLESE